eukprot:TRINITY_DN8688_c0_g1_i3.p2 TRINITY_DN8688_c0_g1~~TRINITY_DN8688_c0_g1_i3.p2  ORF type:complete len:111 (+),score=5.85 TRINITY_DN8688_c0_g1_i3:358-690(+)
MADCNGNDCQTSGSGTYGHTYLQLLDGPIACQNLLPDDQYQCHTTGMDPSYSTTSFGSTGGDSSDTSTTTTTTGLSGGGTSGLVDSSTTMTLGSSFCGLASLLMSVHFRD